MFTAVSSVSPAAATIERLRAFAGVCVRLPAFVDFPIAMALEMALDRNASPDRYIKAFCAQREERRSIA